MKKVVVSPRFQIRREDVESLLRGLGIALVGAALTYLTEYIGKVDFGQYTPVAVAVWSVIANAIRKFLTEKEYIK